MKNNRLRYAATDISWGGLIGMAWYIPIFTLIYIAIFYIFGSAELDNLSYTSIGFNANTVFLLVMGIIIGSYYIKWGITLGVTRKQYYKANLLSGITITFLLTAVVVIIGFLVSLLPFVGSEASEQWENINPFLNVMISFVTAYGAYLAGTLIGTGFYRNAWYGTLAIVITVLGSYVTGIIDPLFVDFFGMTEGLGALMLSILMVVVLAALNFMFVRNIVIRI